MPHDPQDANTEPTVQDWDDLRWADEPGLDDRQFAVEDADDNPPDLPPPVTGAPPLPPRDPAAPDAPQGGAHAG
ncbi:hypothetical protein ACIGD1_07580 [Streptomyces sp. NPDC085612]|uniref:hypothetical protein n=1 Tax=unclassified Streptomyces TaxID=2593676 RepID=UPI0033D1BC4E